ncbi:retinol dehydrogenase 13-like [Amblyomma americanum]|uniref:Dehydrogenase with different specificities related to short-chain alcohol dehydrogenase n=2 Tax=Amblyomma americanum TaxID=6943 RepID=A0AAQ4DUQ1_AMBAM
MASFLKSKPAIFLSAIGAGVGGIVLFKEYIGGCRFDKETRLDGKTVIITGANTGLGKAAAKEFASRGANVIMACRDLTKCRRVRREILTAVENKHVVCEQLDLASLESIRDFATRINESVKQVDILVNNAGVMRCPKLLTKDGFEMQLGVNHMGHFYLTALLLDKIKAAAPSRVVNVSSVAHMRGKINYADFNSDQDYNPADAYNQSKLANVLFTTELAQRLKGTGVSVFAVHPGIVNTEITRHMGIANSWLAAMFAKPLMWLFAKSPRQGVQGILYCAMASGIEEHSGKYFCNCKVAASNPIVEDNKAAAWLWATSEKWTSLS